MMKKMVLWIGAVLIMIGIIVLGIYVIHTPEYALMGIAEDVKESGMDGLQPHLTGDTEELFENIRKVTENKLVRSLTGVFDLGLLESELWDMDWEMKDILKRKDRAVVTLQFDYMGRLQGEVELTMIREEGEWKIAEFDLL